MAVVKIKAQATHHKLFLCVAGGVGLSILFLWWLFFPTQLFVMGLLFALSSVSLLLGLLKLTEPEFAFEIASRGMQYHHRVGSVAFEWHQVLRFGVPNISQGIDLQPLPFVGVKFVAYEEVIESMPLRLVRKLLTEQRSLLWCAQQSGCAVCADDLVLPDSQFKTKDGRIIKGLRGMLANQWQVLAENLGYHLYLPHEAMDRSVDDFVILLKQAHSQSDIS